MAVLLGASAGLSTTLTHSANFSLGQNNATYKVTIFNGPDSPQTNGTVTVTENIPSGLALVSMAGAGWNCPSPGNSCMRSDSLAAGSSYPAITVTVDVASNAPPSVTNQVTVFVAGGAATANDITTIVDSPCDLIGDGVPSVADVQRAISEALGIMPPFHDMNRDGIVNVADVQMVINAAMGMSCAAQ